MIEIAYLSDSWRWLGAHSGYGQLPKYIGQLDGSIRISDTPARLANRIAWQLNAPSQPFWRNLGYRPGSERAFLHELRTRPGCVGHILYFECHHRLLAGCTPPGEAVVATIHHPPAQQSDWDRSLYRDLQRLHAAIVLYERDVGFFARHVAPKRLAFIHHGVDTAFFVPARERGPEAIRLLYVGINARDTRMLEEVVHRITASDPDIQFDFVVPKGVHQLRKLWRHPKITWHRNISDDRLRALYQSSYLLLLPLKSAGANNSVVEALACGLPPVTTDVGGIRDYGGGTLYPVAAPNDSEAMVRLIHDYRAETRWRDEVGRQCRAFAEQHLAWPKVAQRHLQVYERVLG